MAILQASICFVLFLGTMGDELLEKKNSTGPVHIHIRAPDPFESSVGDGSSITCSILADERDYSFDMYLNGVPWNSIFNNGSSVWSAANFTRSFYTYKNGSIETAIEGFIDTFVEEQNNTFIYCRSNENNIAAYKTLLFADNGTSTVHIHIRAPDPFESSVGDGSSITCSILADERDYSFGMYLNGVPWNNISNNGSSVWSAANFKRSFYTYKNGSIETAIEGFIDTFVKEQNNTFIFCHSVENSIAASKMLYLAGSSNVTANISMMMPEAGSEVGWPASIACWIEADAEDRSFQMYIDGDRWDNLDSNSTWANQYIERGTWDSGVPGVVTTGIFIWVDQLTADMNGTEIFCGSKKYNKFVYDNISLPTPLRCNWGRQYRSRGLDGLFSDRFTLTYSQCRHTCENVSSCGGCTCLKYGSRMCQMASGSSTASLYYSRSYNSNIKSCN